MTSQPQSRKNPPLPELVLASSSPYRRMLLDRLGLPYRCLTPDIDESPEPEEAVAALTTRLAREKAQAVAATLSGPALVIGSDQLASLNGQPLGKPGHFDRALEQLLSMRGQTVEFLTALHVLNTESGAAASHLDTTLVRFRDFSRQEAEYYLRQEQPWNCAGSFKSEGLGIALFEAIESQDPTALIGLPLIALCRLLGELGRPVLQSIEVHPS